MLFFREHCESLTGAGRRGFQKTGKVRTPKTDSFFMKSEKRKCENRRLRGLS
ncbi:Uncharacterized protein dnm_074150 [Desulfonema magnum]|uniref:Uncharacterized protein n=1 Tax=Desulfonema magnum TaxID=45655 RepID=A0A975GRW0_9BACT|nr:Uncharacterized protein dnm_074150 [Desulfonema magnum]